MNTRRTFFGVLAGLAGYLFGDKARAGSKTPAGIQYRTVYRHDGKAWQRIAWKDMRPGDKVLMVGAHDTLEFQAWEIDSHPSGMAVKVRQHTDMLPVVWGACPADQP